MRAEGERERELGGFWKLHQRGDPRGRNSTLISHLVPPSKSSMGLPHLMRLVHMQPYQERRRRRQAQATSKPPPPVSLSSLPDGQGAGTIHYSSLSMLFLRVSKPRRCCCSRLPSFSIGLKIKICRSLFLWLQRLYLFHYRVIEEAKVLTHLLIV